MTKRKIVIHNHLPRARDINAFEHALPREQEERNRDKAYRDSGIVRVLASDASPAEVAGMKAMLPSMSLKDLEWQVANAAKLRIPADINKMFKDELARRKGN